MLNSVIRFSLRNRALVIMAAITILVAGSYVAARMPIDIFPDLDRPRVTLLTECNGLATEDVEALVTAPLEAALLGATGVETVRSQSVNGFSIVNVEFGWGRDIRAARQGVQERLTSAVNELPAGCRPQMAPVSSIMGQIVVTGLRRQTGPGGGVLAMVPGTPYVAERVMNGDTATLAVWKPVERAPATWTRVECTDVKWALKTSSETQVVTVVIHGTARTIPFASERVRQMELRTLADWVVRPRLLKLPGVAQIFVIGAGRKQYQVHVDPQALTEYSVTLADIETALRNNNDNYSGGILNLSDRETPVRVVARLGPRPEQVLEQLKMIPVKLASLRAVRLDQVATIVEDAQLPRGDASMNGHPGVALIVTKQPNVDTRALTDLIGQSLKDVEASLPADVVVETELYKLRDFIDRGVANVTEALAIGAGLVFIILFLFLLNLRTTFISLTAIPLSLAVTALVFKLIGLLTGDEFSLNVMTLGGIAVALGELVDDAIVDVENIHRRLRENRGSATPKPALQMVLDASIEVRSAIVFGTAVVILVFLPLFALSGLEGRFFTPLAFAYITSIFASLAVSLTVTPVLASYLLDRHATPHRERDGLLLRGMKRCAAYLVRFSMRRTTLILAVTWLSVSFAAWRVTTLGRDFLPKFDEGAVQLSVTLPAGSSIEASTSVANAIDTKIGTWLKSPTNPRGLLLSYFHRAGRAEHDEHADPPNASDNILIINPDCGKTREEVLATIQAEIAEVAPGVDVEVEQPLAHLISENASGAKAQIVIKVFGDDLDTLEKLANSIKARITTIDGVTAPAVESMRKVDEIHIKLRPEDLAEFGLDRATVGKFVETAIKGEVVSQVIEGQRRFDLVLKLDDVTRHDVTQLGRLRIDLPNNRGQVYLAELADITPRTGGDTGPNQIRRENLRRRILIRCNARGRDLAGAVTDIRAAIRTDVPLPQGYFVEYAGQYESQERATRIILGLSVAALAGMFFVLYQLTPSVRIVLQILHAIPTAFVGGVLALVITEQSLTVASLVGFISLGGIAVRNGILLVTHYLHLMEQEGEQFNDAMILRGSLERLAPVLMTALTAGIGLVPLVVAGHQPGREILYPVATVILGGLVTCTLCEFLLHPGLFRNFSGRETVIGVEAPVIGEQKC